MRIDGYQIFGEVAYDSASPGRAYGFLHDSLDAAKESATKWLQDGAFNVRIVAVERGQYRDRSEVVWESPRASLMPADSIVDAARAKYDPPVVLALKKYIGA